MACQCHDKTETARGRNLCSVVSLYPRVDLRVETPPGARPSCLNSDEDKVTRQTKPSSRRTNKTEQSQKKMPFSLATFIRSNFVVATRIQFWWPLMAKLCLFQCKLGAGRARKHKLWQQIRPARASSPSGTNAIVRRVDVITRSQNRVEIWGFIHTVPHIKTNSPT
jgi:hypothetical protein